MFFKLTLNLKLVFKRTKTSKEKQTNIKMSQQSFRVKGVKDIELLDCSIGVKTLVDYNLIE